MSPGLPGCDVTRRALDAYYTPDDLAEALVSVLPVQEWDTALEPSCGGGAFVRAMQRRKMQVLGMDIDGEAAGLRGLSHAIVADFLAYDFAYHEPLWVIGNPPFSDAEAHVRHALDVTDRHVAFLLRLAFLESRKRVPFWREHPPRKVWVLSERPSFTGGATDSCAYGWFWFDKEHRGPTELGWLSWK